jgi:hypothetical protein
LCRADGNVDALFSGMGRKHSDFDHELADGGQFESSCQLAQNVVAGTPG